MVLHEWVTRHRSRSDSFVLYPIGDIHIGARACDLDSLRATVRDVEKDDSAVWIGMGDYAENINISDKRFDLKSVDPRFLSRLDDLPNACFEELLELFKPIAGKCIGLLTGNHEETLRLKYSHDVHGALCLRLGVKNLGYDSMIRLKFVREGKGNPSSVVTVFASHGTIAGRKDGAKMNRMGELAMNFDADLYLVGHGHSQIIGRSARLEVPESGELKLRERLRMACMTGTFRKSYERDTRDYSEKAHHSPPVIGCPKIVIRPWAEPRSRFQAILG